VFSPARAAAQQVIEADEVIHVGMGDEMWSILRSCGAQAPGVPRSKKQGSPAVSQIQVQGGVPEGR